MTDNKIKFKELNKENWKDFELLFGDRGACGGCWCMYWRLRNKEFEKLKGAGNKNEMKKLVKAKKQVGIIMYEDNHPVGWCSFAPREDFVRLKNSRILKHVDDKPVWSITCFFIDKDHRKKGYSVELLKAALITAEKKGAEILEGYPVEPKKGNMPPVFAWTGISTAFKKAGFKEVARRSETRPVMRCYL